MAGQRSYCGGVFRKDVNHMHPQSESIRATRQRLGLSVAEAASLVHVDPRTWRRWEDGTRTMPAGAWELFLIKIGEPPNES